ncbi:50S ribosomal protein L37e [Candidatus Woesearchaeota archaeon]|nr:50S ribosomal protein L37e [Candidatus Woesearchaeota archaeon]
MSKGTASMGVKSGKKNHIYCRRCGRKTYHLTRKRCSSCGYGKSARIRAYTWAKKKH